MSAFCGHFCVDGESADERQLAAQLGAIKARGPDDHGTFSEKSFAAAHALLSITPESAKETSPWIGCEGRLVVVFDGRLDHREDLLDRLGIPKYERALPDPELVARAFERWGEDCPAQLEGEFAFVVWVRRENRIFAACEAFERRDFFYHFDGRRFAFASAIRGVLALPDISARLDELTLACQLTYTPRPLGRTLYAGISRLPGGHLLTLKDAGEPKVRRFWSLGAGPEIRLKNSQAYAEALRELLDRAVTSALRSRHPVAAMLSGGLDSTGVTGLAAQKHAADGRNMTVVSNVLAAGFEGPERSREESGYIADVLAMYPNLRGLQATGDEFPVIDFDNGWYEFNDEPDEDLKSFRTRELCRLAMDAGARVLLNGYGGDLAASYAGHGYLVQLFRQGRWLEMWRQVNLQHAAGAGSRLRMLRREVLRPLLPKSLLRSYRRFRGAVDLPSAIHPEFFNRMNLGARQREAEAARDHPDVRVSMRHGFNGLDTLGNVRWPRPTTPLLECPQPLMDLRLWDWCNRIPLSEFVREGRPRGLYRDALSDVLPQRIRGRTDKGWYSPDYQQRLAECEAGIRDFMDQHPASETMWNYVDRSKVEGCLERLKGDQSGRPSNLQVQLILCLGLRMSEFIDRF